MDSLAPEFVERARWRYEAMTAHAGLRIFGRPVHGSPEGFAHLVSQGGRDPGGQRVPKARRLAAVGHVWAMLERLAEQAPEVRWWREEARLYVASEDFGLVAVLKPLRADFRLVTAYPISATWQASRRALAARYAASWASGQSFPGCFAIQHAQWRETEGCCRLPVRPLNARVRTRGGMPAAWHDSERAPSKRLRKSLQA